MSGDAIDRLARRLASGEETPRGEDVLLSRGSFLRAGALGALALAFRGLPEARAATDVLAGCHGGTVASCNREGQKTFKATLGFCDKVYTDKNDPFGMSRYSCWVDAQSARIEGRKYCQQNCKPKAPGGGKGGGGGGGGGGGQGGGSAHTPTCGYVDCVEGDKCCPLQGGGDVCCAIGCARTGDGCCSSDTDC